MKVIVDAMGGDHAPQNVIAGVRLLLKDKAFQNHPFQIYLLGDEAKIKPHLKKITSPHIKLIHCSEIIEMSESPVQAVKQKKDSSIIKGLKLVADAPYESAFFSAGHSGAVFAGALMTLGRIKGVERPAIATVLPSISGHCILLDAGANVDCRASHLADFAKMGAVYAQTYLKRSNPVVGILSNGEEEGKGTDLTREGHILLKQVKEFRYIGYVEGKEIFFGSNRRGASPYNGPLDVVVTDGFTGNIVLKSIEGLGRMVSTVLKSELNQSVLGKLGALLSWNAFKKVQKKLDYAEVGSAPLLGVDGNCFIGHGRSSPKAIKNGILRAHEAIALKLLDALRNSFNQKE